MKADKIISILKKECEKSGSQKAWAKANGLSQAYVCDVLQGKRGIGAAIANALGYRQIISYRKAL